MRKLHRVLAAALVLASVKFLLADEYHGINPGAPIWGGSIILTDAKAAAIAATGCRAVRVNFRMDGHATWDAGLLAQYNTVVQNARNHHLVVLGLLCNECMPVGQPQYNDDPDGDGLNDYVTQYSATALLIVNRYKDSIKRWEIWNEPGAWTNSNYANDPKNAGGTYILPRVYANLLAETYKQLNYYSGRTILTDNRISLVSGGLFAHDIGGSFSTGMDYMLQVYGRTAVWDWLQANVGRRYPWEYFGYHFYLNMGEAVSTQELGSYFNDVRTKQASHSDVAPMLITEFGWNSASVSENLQRDNMHNTYQYMETKSYIAGTYWYQWSDESDTGKYGIVRLDGTHKPAYDEFVLQNPLPQFAPGDLDQDGDVDQEDFGLFQVCLSGPGVAQTDPACLGAHLDADDDVDQTDLAIFERCFTAPGVPAQLDCDQP